MAEFEERTRRHVVSDTRNPRIDDFSTLDQILDILNNVLAERREEFFSDHPKRPKDVCEDLSSCSLPEPSGSSVQDEIEEFAEDVTNPVELGTSLFYQEDLARRFAMHLCSEVENVRMWQQFGLRIDTIRHGFRTRFEVECHETVETFVRNEWLEEKIETFDYKTTVQSPDKRRRLDTGGPLLY